MSLFDKFKKKEKEDKPVHNLIEILDWRKDPDNYNPDADLDEDDEYEDDYSELHYAEYELSERDGFIEAHDEEGNGVEHCANCYMYFDFNNHNYYCPQCGLRMSRVEYFDYIGADPPMEECWTCNRDYPFCRVVCSDLEDNYPEYYNNLP